MVLQSLFTLLIFSCFGVKNHFEYIIQFKPTYVSNVPVEINSYKKLCLERRKNHNFSYFIIRQQIGSSNNITLLLLPYYPPLYHQHVGYGWTKWLSMLVIICWWIGQLSSDNIHCQLSSCLFYKHRILTFLSRMI